MSDDGVHIYRQRNRDLHYVWFGDVAEGLEHGDNSDLCWLCCETGEQVAHYNGKLAGMELGELAYDMGEYYNWAYGCFENNKDQTPNNKLIDMGYPQLHYEQKLGEQAGPKDTRKPGWNTNTLTRYWMVRHGITFSRDGSVKPKSKRLFDEMEIFAQNARGKYEAIPGGHDDAVMGYLGAIQMWDVWMKMHNAEKGIAPLVGDKVAEVGVLGLDLLSEEGSETREERLSKKALERLRERDEDPEMEAMVW